VLLPASVGSKVTGQCNVLQLRSSRQPLCAEVHACEGSAIAFPTSNRFVAGTNRPSHQSAPARMDQLLWALCAIGSRPVAPTCRPEVSGLGGAEVQTFQSSQDPSEPLPANVVPVALRASRGPISSPP